MKVPLALLVLTLASVTYGSPGYTQAWLKGEQTEVGAHPHEGLRLAGGEGWVAVGENIGDCPQFCARQVRIVRVDNDGNVVWTTLLGDTHQNANQLAHSSGFSVAQDGNILYVGSGQWQKNLSQMKPAVSALDVATGHLIWTKLVSSQAKHGGVRGIIVDGQRLICTGYVNSHTPGFLFVADESKPAVWELEKSNGNVVKENLLNVEGLGQGAKIRKDKVSGYVMTSTAWGPIGGQEVNVVAVVKLSNSLDVEWSKMYGMAGGDSQAFDMLVDNDGNYLMGGHTTVGSGVVNWDYLALKVNSQTKEVMWRKTFGQPRKFNAQYIHDEMYGVALDASGNYVLIGGSGDEYTYSETDPNTNWSSDIWVSYLVVVDPATGTALFEDVYGDKGANNAGEYLSLDTNTGEIMINTDSDSFGGGFGFLKLSPTSSPPTASPPQPSTTTAAPPQPSTTTAAPPQPSTTTAAPTQSPSTASPPTTTSSPTTTTKEPEDPEDSGESGESGSWESCFDDWPKKKCQRKKAKGKCWRKWVAKNCQETCGEC